MSKPVRQGPVVTDQGFRIKLGGTSMNRTAIEPNEATLQDLEGGWQFVPKFGTKSFIITDDGIFVRGPYGSETYRKIAPSTSHHVLELQLRDAPGAIMDAFKNWQGSYVTLKHNLMDWPGFFHIKRIRSASMNRAAMIQVGDVCKVGNLASIRDMNPHQLRILRDVVRQGGRVDVEKIIGDNAFVSAHDNPMSKIMDGVNVPVSALFKVASRVGASINGVVVARELVAIAKEL